MVNDSSFAFAQLSELEGVRRSYRPLASCSQKSLVCSLQASEVIVVDSHLTSNSLRLLLTPSTWESWINDCWSEIAAKIQLFVVTSKRVDGWKSVFCTILQSRSILFLARAAAITAPADGYCWPRSAALPTRVSNAADRSRQIRIPPAPCKTLQVWQKTTTFATKTTPFLFTRQLWQLRTTLTTQNNRRQLLNS